METMISMLIFLATALLIIGLQRLSAEKQEHINKRLNNMTAALKEGAAENNIVRPRLEAKALLSVMGRNFVSLSFTRKIEGELAKADILMRSEEFIGLNILTTILGGFLGSLIFGFGSLVFIMVLLGVFSPWVYLYWKKRQRAALLNSEIAESLTGMSNSLRTGYSFQQAMDMVSKETIGPLATEYRRTMREINLGVTTEQALQNLIQRVGDDDLELMIGAVLIQRQIGGNLAEIFDNIADTIRQRIRMRGEVRTLTAQGRISGWVIGGLPIALALILMVVNPDYMNVIFASEKGWYILGGAAVSETIGFIIINKITDIKL
ncbi:MAG TPA: type II secretion system F family protein [Syntrophomonadaceae bacterium]|nr:type II secretion system F family protein [Syntrophomonadaceae bacterium]HPR92802.1 type II secretion system F family protein [Syntrophomonadaceae bacterium]